MPSSIRFVHQNINDRFIALLPVSSHQLRILDDKIVHSPKILRLQLKHAINQANVRAHRTQATFATQPTMSKRSGAARLLGG
jgi:hypothetical protein